MDNDLGRIEAKLNDLTTRLIRTEYTIMLVGVGVGFLVWKLW